MRISKEVLIVGALAVAAAATLTYWHVGEKADLQRQFIARQVDTVFHDKRIMLEEALNSVYENVRTITLLPSVKAIAGGNRRSDHEDVVKAGRFSAEGWATVQQIYNNLAGRVSVSEVYAVIDGFDAAKGEIPFFMFDTVVFAAGKAQEVEPEQPSADAPEESEAAEYDYFPGQLAAMKQAHPRFDFQSMDAVPAFGSPLMRTCDNSQYQSIAHDNVKDAFGILYSVPFYDAAGDFRGAISAIIRANVLEAMLLGVPFVPVTAEDRAAQQAAAWQLPDPAPFQLENAKQGIRIFDRREGRLPELIAAGEQGRNVFQATLGLHSDSDWTLTYYLPEAMIEAATAEHDQLYMTLMAVVLGTLVAAGGAMTQLARIRRRLGGQTEQVAQVVHSVSEGDLDVALPSGVAADSVLDSMGNMLEKLRAADKARRENTRVRQALDGVSTRVVIADNDGRRVYANRAAQGMLEEYRIEAELDRHLAAEGGCDQLEVEADGRSLVISCNPVVGDAGESLGKVLEWTDRTAQVALQRAEQDVLGEIADAVDAAVNGDFSRRISLDGRSGFMRELGASLNHLLQTTQDTLQATSQLLAGLARGDLSRTNNDNCAGIFGQLRDDTNATIAQLREVIDGLQKAIATIGTAAQEIAAGNADLSRRTETQAMAVERTSATMAQLNGAVRQNAETAEQARALTLSSSELAAQGGAIVRSVVGTMSEIEASSRKITEIISVINGIAFQTNILALNASVEAARAGEQGRGFAVVAGEVRNLAQRCASAAKEIGLLISESADKVGAGSRLVDEAGETIDAMVERVRDVAELVNRIAAANKEQSTGIGQAADAIGRVGNDAQQNAALVEESAAAAGSLSEQAESLARMVAMFKLRAEDSRPVAELRSVKPNRSAAR